MTEFLTVALRAAKAGGEILLGMREHVVAREKGPRDLVSEADLLSQKCIRDILLTAFPDHDFLGEEDGPEAASILDSEYCWIVDPLDGTTNYLHQLQTFAVSIALEHRGKLVCGVVYDPVANECFAAARGQGATLNDKPLRTSRCTRLSDALVAASFSPLVDRDSIEIRRFIEALVACQGVRRLGSAALNLAYVAAGRLDAYWATAVKVWDVAAGVIIIEEAGGSVSNISGAPLDHRYPELAASATAELQSQVIELMQRANPSVASG